MAYNYKFYTNTSRYFNNIDVAEFSNGFKLPLTMRKMTFSENDIALYYTVPANFKGRMDLVANAVYRDPTLFWAICEANNIDDLIGYNEDADYSEVPRAGEVLKIPNIESVRRYMQ